jgi:hypothetical protein
MACSLTSETEMNKLKEEHLNKNKELNMVKRCSTIIRRMVSKHEY